MFLPHNIYLGPPAGTIFGDMDDLAEIAELFEMGVRSVLQEEEKVDTVAKRILEFCQNLGNDTLKVGKIRDELLKVIGETKKLQGIVPDIDDKEIENIIDTAKGKQLALDSIRGQVTGLFLGVLKRILKNPEYAMKMTPKQIGDWFKMVREEEDKERRTRLMEDENLRENLKTKLLFFRAMEGGLTADDINMLEADLRDGLSGFMRDGRQLPVLEGELADNEAPRKDTNNKLPEGSTEGA